MTQEIIIIQTQHPVKKAHVLEWCGHFQMLKSWGS